MENLTNQDTPSQFISSIDKMREIFSGICDGLIINYEKGENNVPLKQAKKILNHIAQITEMINSLVILDLKDILNNTIKKGFPELLSKDIEISWKDDLDDLMCIGELEDEGYYIEVDTSLKKAPVEVLIGGISHELSHIIRDSRETIFEKILYKFSQRYKISVERDIDTECIIRGFLDELYKFTKYASKKWSRYEEDGLSLSELELIKKNRK